VYIALNFIKKQVQIRSGAMDNNEKVKLRMRWQSVATNFASMDKAEIKEDATMLEFMEFLMTWLCHP